MAKKRAALSVGCLYVSHSKRRENNNNNNKKRKRKIFSFWWVFGGMSRSPAMSLHFHTSLKRTSSLLERSPSFDTSGKYVIYFQITDSLSLSLFLAVYPIYSNFPSFSFFFWLYIGNAFFFPHSTQMALFLFSGGYAYTQGIQVYTHTHTFESFWREGRKV